MGLIVLLVLIEPDLGTAASIALTAIILLYLGGLRYRYLLGLMVAAIPALYFFVVQVPYRLDRFLAYLYPERDPYGIGYQIRQSLIAVGSGGWSGLGYAEGKQKLSFLPEPHTDFYLCRGGRRIGSAGMFHRCGSLQLVLLESGSNLRARPESFWNLFRLGNRLHDHSSGLRKHEHGGQSFAHQRTSAALCLCGRILNDHDDDRCRGFC